MSKGLMRTRTMIGLVSLAMVVAATASCGDVVRSTDSPAMLVVNQLTASGTNTLNSDVVLSTGTVLDDMASANVGVIMKDIVAPTSTNNDVTIRRYRVEYIRADGHNTPGVDVPYPFDGAVTITIPAGGTGSFTFELVRHVAKKEAPLAQLVTNVSVLSTIAQVTFFGEDQTGNELSATGSITVNFLNLGD